MVIEYRAKKNLVLNLIAKLLVIPCPLTNLHSHLNKWCEVPKE